ncbi:hypothetical protein HK098_000238 [Nowakowskiella sp. JEL0407]|nr:hypothetical protein HK098_000238 [Nowakowskiella sp. JEL0407]
MENTEISNHQKFTPIKLFGYNLEAIIASNIFRNNTLSGTGGVMVIGLFNSSLDVRNNTFTKNTANYGGVFYVSAVNGRFSIPPKLEATNFYDSVFKFQNNTFMNNIGDFGGVLYSDMNEFAVGGYLSGNLYANNSALMAGAIFYFPRKKFIPVGLRDTIETSTIAGMNNTAPYDNFVTTDPVKLTLLNKNSSTPEIILLYSGSFLPELEIGLLDEFNQTVITPTDYIFQDSVIMMQGRFSNSNTSLAKMHGGLCVVYNGKCIMRGGIVGEPGTYIVEISATATKFKELRANLLSQNVEITECPSGLVSVNIPGTRFPVCKEPDCEQSCGIHGKCVNTNMCICEIGFQGDTCSEKKWFLISEQLISQVRIVSVIAIFLLCGQYAVIAVFGRKFKSYASSDKILQLGIFLGTEDKLLSVGLFFSVCQDMVMLFAISCVEICVLCLSIYWYLPVWEAPGKHIENKFALLGLCNWVVSGPILNVRILLQEFLHARVLISIFQDRLKYYSRIAKF